MRETHLSSVNLRLIAYTHSLSHSVPRLFLLSLSRCPTISLSHTHTHTLCPTVSLTLSLSLSFPDPVCPTLSLYLYLYFSFYPFAFFSQSPCLPSFIFSVTCVCVDRVSPHLTTLSRYVTDSLTALYISLQCGQA